MAQLSPALSQFCSEHGYPQWGFNAKGHHVVHAIIEEMRKERVLYSYEILEEVVSRMQQEYGHVNVKTTGLKPPSCTPFVVL